MADMFLTFTHYIFFLLFQIALFMACVCAAVSIGSFLVCRHFTVLCKCLHETFSKDVTVTKMSSLKALNST